MAKNVDELKFAYSSFLASVVLVRLLVTFFTDEADETAAAEATLVAS